jgi:hypothetical protein
MLGVLRTEVNERPQRCSASGCQDDVAESCHAQKSGTAENHEGQGEDEQRNHGADGKQM